jgi:hypothetical protein
MWSSPTCIRPTRGIGWALVSCSELFDPHPARSIDIAAAAINAEARPREPNACRPIRALCNIAFPLRNVSATLRAVKPHIKCWPIAPTLRPTGAAAYGGRT